MKSKSIISLVFVAVFAAGMSSCEDMLKVDSKTYDYGHEMTAQDTVYSVMGIVQKMQVIADRTVLLGEIRGDLVTLTGKESPDIAELRNFNYANLSADNKYNRPIDYYSVINNCNYFLANVDTALSSNGKNVFLKEYIPVLCFRAWTYLQMAQIYGRVYYVDKPITSGDDADGSNWPLCDIKTLAKRLVAEFEENESRYVNYKLLKYGSLGGNDNDEGSKSQKHNAENLIIPVRLIMGDLYLWAEEYEKAAKCYHDYLYYNDNGTNLNVVPTGGATILWNGTTFAKLGEDSYAGTFGDNAKPITYIPMESEEYAGVTSELPDLFNSTKENHYYPQLTWSNAMESLSERQDYCYHKIIKMSGVPVATFMSDPTVLQSNPLLRGDLRLQSIFEIKVNKEAKTLLDNVSSQKLKKINSEKISLYRNDVVYLRLAEALNRAGMPHLAFAILKNGLTDIFIADSISLEEQDMAKKLGITFPDGRFEAVQYSLYKFDADATSAPTINNDPYNPVSEDYVQVNLGQNNMYNTMGIHSRGSGDAALNSRYVIKPTENIDAKMDTIRRVEEMIIDEMALETCFEGYRFGDLMRISMHRASDEGYPGAGGVFDTDFLARRVASRDCATVADPYAGVTLDQDLYDILYGDGTSFNQRWFLRLNTSIYY